MKSNGIFGLVVTLIIGLQGNYLQAQTTRYPAISAWVYNNIQAFEAEAESQIYPKSIIRLEGQFSDDASSLELVSDYYMVRSPGLPGGATVLKFGPLPRSGNGIWYAPIHFKDMMNGTAYDVSYDAFTLCGTFMVAGEKIWMKVSYGADTQHPRVQLTWGAGAGYGTVGNVIDDFSVSIINPIVPVTSHVTFTNPDEVRTNTSAAISLKVTNPDDTTVLQTSTNLVQWTDSPVAPSVIFGYSGYYSLQRAPRMFFRTVTRR